MFDENGREGLAFSYCHHFCYFSTACACEETRKAGSVPATTSIAVAAAPVVVRRDKSDPALRLGMTRFGRKPDHLGLLLDYRHSCFGYLPRSSFLMLG